MSITTLLTCNRARHYYNQDPNLNHVGQTFLISQYLYGKHMFMELKRQRSSQSPSQARSEPVLSILYLLTPDPVNII